MKPTILLLFLPCAVSLFAQCPGSPIIIDLTGQGFPLTDVAEGVEFNITGTAMEQIAWTAPGSRLAFLALDRNGNGVIDSGLELFGNYTDQDSPFVTANGFSALEVFDRPENGGNGDGVIDSRDAVFSHLLLWIDENHDGKSQPQELHSLPSLGVYSISLKYKWTPKKDQYGNQFRYKAEVNPGTEPHTDTVGRYAYDVFFLRK